MDRKRSGCQARRAEEATANCRGADGVQPAVVPMEQPAPTMAQNTNDDEEEEILIDTEEQVVFTLAEVGRRADGDGIDTESPCIGPLRAVQLLKVASQHGVLERLPLTTEQRVLKEKLVAIKAAASSCIEISAVPFFGNLAKRGIAPSARDAAESAKETIAFGGKPIRLDRRRRLGAPPRCRRPRRPRGPRVGRHLRSHARGRLFPRDRGVGDGGGGGGGRRRHDDGQVAHEKRGELAGKVGRQKNPRGRSG